MLAYTPIDISINIPDGDVLKEYFFNNYMTNLKETFGYTSLLCALISRNSVTDWRDATQVFADHTDSDLFYAPNVKEIFPELIEFVHTLPYKEIIGAVLNLHTEYLPPHQDEFINLNVDGPERYNVLLTPHYEQESFFICKDKNSEKIYPKILKEYPVYAFSNNKVFHGADKVLKERIILICAGILDEEKHDKLVKASSEKFKDYVIRF